MEKNIYRKYELKQFFKLYKLPDNLLFLLNNNMLFRNYYLILIIMLVKV
jgi:hypothetical protein